jgi:hypothetical protein
MMGFIYLKSIFVRNHAEIKLGCIAFMFFVCEGSFGGVGCSSAHFFEFHEFGEVCV